jgi:four helix bundle protein
VKPEKVNMAQHLKDLIVWQKAMDLNKAMDLIMDVYQVTESFPKPEVYSLTDQIRRAAVSIPCKIAEGQAHFSKARFCHFLRHSSSSLAEFETQLLIAEGLEYTGPDQNPDVAEASRRSRQAPEWT